MNKEDLILEEVRNLRKELCEMRECVTTLKVEVSALKVKSSVWGALAGFLPAAAVVIWILVK